LMGNHWHVLVYMLFTLTNSYVTLFAGGNIGQKL